MVQGVTSSFIPYQGYPANATGATGVTKDIASYCYDTQKNNISKTYTYLTTDDNPSYKWPVIGTVVSLISLIAVRCMRH